MTNEEKRKALGRAIECINFCLSTWEGPTRQEVFNAKALLEEMASSMTIKVPITFRIVNGCYEVKVGDEDWSIDSHETIGLLCRAGVSLTLEMEKRDPGCGYSKYGKPIRQIKESDEGVAMTVRELIAALAALGDSVLDLPVAGGTGDEYYHEIRKGGVYIFRVDGVLDERAMSDLVCIDCNGKLLCNLLQN